MYKCMLIALIFFRRSGNHRLENNFTKELSCIANVGNNITEGGKRETMQARETLEMIRRLK